MRENEWVGQSENEWERTSDSDSECVRVGTNEMRNTTSQRERENARLYAYSYLQCIMLCTPSTPTF